MAGPTPEAVLKAERSRTDRYRLGQFFTPEPVAKFMARAVLDTRPQTICDPGVGGGVLLRSIGAGPKLYGCDIDPRAVEVASQALPEAEIVRGNFLARRAWPFSVDSFDAVICNPPYIRHHNLTAADKRLAAFYSKLFETQVSSLSGSYVYFFLETIRRLREGGRLVFITPTEFLDARYGRALKEVLLRHCRLEEILVLDMTELAFEGVLTTSAITIATKSREGTETFRLTEARLADTGVERRDVAELCADRAPVEAAWTSLLPSRSEEIKRLTRGRTAKLGDYARIRRGIASGDNSFFCLTQAEVEKWRIEPEFLVPVVVGARDLPREGPLTEDHWRQRLRDGARGWLLWCHAARDELEGTNVLRYIEHGERLGLHKRFNCRTRDPWYGVERVGVPDFFVTYMSRENARFVANEAGARCMTSLLNLWIADGIDSTELTEALGEEDLPRLLRAFGRTYGGGLGKIEPNTLRELPVRPIARREPRLRAA